MKFELSEQEIERVREWTKYHANTHKISHTGAIGGRWTYHITPTTMGHMIRIGCFCGAAAEVSDICHPEEIFPKLKEIQNRTCGGRICGFWTDADGNCDPCGKPKQNE